jgi:hypothetical protein
MKPIKPTCHNCFYKEILEEEDTAWCYMFDDMPEGNPPLCMKWEWSEEEASSEDAEEEQDDMPPLVDFLLNPKDD